MGAVKIDWKQEDLNHSSGARKTIEETTIHSPLFHIRTVLKCLRLLLGFPLTPTNMRWDDFVFKSCREHTKLILIMILFLTPNVMIMGFLGNDVNAFKKMYNISSMDFIVEMFALFVIPFGFNLVYFITFKNNTKRINKICKIISNINYRQDFYHNHNDIHIKANERVFKAIIMYLMMGIVIAGLFITANYCAMTFEEFDAFNEHSKAILSGIQPITVLLGPLSPMVSSGDFVVNYLIGHLSENLKRLRLTLKPSKVKEDPIFIKHLVVKYDAYLDRSKDSKRDEMMFNENESMEIIIDLILDTCRAIKKVNKTFAAILFYAYAGNLLIATTAFYTFAKCIFINKFSPMTFCWGILNLVSFILYMTRLYESTTAGHNLGQNMISLRESFKIYCSSQCAIKTNNTKYIDTEKHEGKIEIINDLLDNSSPISPYGYFGMTGGSFLSALATISTYLIVLIQFKTSEK